MEALIPLLLQLAQTAIPALGSATAIGKAITILSALAPVLVKEFNDVKPSIMGIIDSLRSHPKALADQRADLDAISAKVDAEFEAAAAAALAEDRIAEATSTQPRP